MYRPVLRGCGFHGLPQDVNTLLILRVRGMRSDSIELCEIRHVQKVVVGAYKHDLHYLRVGIPGGATIDRA